MHSLKQNRYHIEHVVDPTSLNIYVQSIKWETYNHAESYLHD